MIAVAPMMRSAGSPCSNISDCASTAIRGVIGRTRKFLAATTSSINRAASVAGSTLPRAISRAISQRVTSLIASGPSAPASARRARAERRFGSMTSWISTCVSITTKLGVPDLARGRDDVADDACLATQRLQSLLRRRLTILLRNDSRNHAAAHRHLHRLASLHAREVGRKILTQLRDLDFRHKRYVQMNCTHGAGPRPSPVVTTVPGVRQRKEIGL